MKLTLAVVSYIEALEASAANLDVRRTSTKGATMKNGFWEGMMAYAFATSLIQDMYGLEGWLAHIKTGWIDAKYSVPIAIVGLLMVASSIILDKIKSRLTNGVTGNSKTSSD